MNHKGNRKRTSLPNAYFVGYFLLIMLALALGLMACSDDENKGDTGTLSLSLADSPINADNVDGVFLTIVGIEYNLNNSWEAVDSTLINPGPHNLLDLTGGITVLLGEFELEAGQYSQIRFLLDAFNQGDTGIPSNPGSYITFTDGTEKPLYVPSGSETGYKTVGKFSVPINGKVSVTADWDVRRSVVETGSGKYILKPTVRLVGDDNVGQIKGTITNGSGYALANMVVLTYETGTFALSELLAGADTNEFPNAITSSQVNANDAGYALPFLSTEVTYELVIAAYDGAGQFMELLTVDSASQGQLSDPDSDNLNELIEGAVITSGQATKIDITVSGG